MPLHLIAFVAGLIAATGFQPLGLWPAMPLAFAIFLWSLAQAPRLRTALARGWWFGLGQFVVGLNWIATAFTYQAKMPPWLGWIAVVLLSLYLAVYPALAAGLAWRWGRGSRSAISLALAAAWIVTEWLRATMFTGFAWNPVGVALLPTFFARAATLVGTYGVSGLAVLLGAALWQLGDRHWRSGLALAAGAAALALAGLAASPPVSGAAGPLLRIAQPNIGQDLKSAGRADEEALDRLRALSLHDPARPTLILWPEAAVDEPIETGLTYPFAQAEAAQLRAEVGAAIGPGDLLLSGFVTARSRDGRHVSSGSNSVFALAADGRVLARYDKAHLVPYGEYLPMRPILAPLGLARLVPGDLDFDPGPGPRTFDLPMVGKVGFQLCYEIVFSGEVVDRANRPAFLFNPSNDAWFGSWGPPQHLAQARMRALEEGVPILRSTPTGISAVVDADGGVVASIALGKMGAIDSKLPAPKPPSLFARAGNLMPFLFALLLAAAAIAVRRKRRYGRI
jgi:apolipoprotein N-acyltransferase